MTLVQRASALVFHFIKTGQRQRQTSTLRVAALSSPSPLSLSLWWKKSQPSYSYLNQTQTQAQRKISIQAQTKTQTPINRYRFLSSSSSSSSGSSSSSTSSSKRTSKRPRSPYAILHLKTSATEHDIKAAFRKLAKQYHPDLNPHLSPDVSQSKMSELIQAYEQLTDDDFLGVRVGDGRVALACEMFTLDELCMDNLHDVYPIRIMFMNDDYGDDSDDGGNGDQKGNESISIPSSELELTSLSASASVSALSKDYTIDLIVHPEDSISDVKRQLQSMFEVEWGLEGRKLDRDKIRTGWEIVCKDRDRDRDRDTDMDTDTDVIMDQRKGDDNDAIHQVHAGQKDEDGDDDHEHEHEHDLRVMSYHLFVHSYGIQHGDVIHAVVRKYDT